MRRIHPLIFLGVVITVLGILFLATSSPSDAQNDSQAAPSSTPSTVQGVAIPLRPTNDPALTVPGARFTCDDAAQWVGSHSVPLAVVSAKPAADICEFITSQQTSVRLKGESPGIPDNALVCYVTFHGRFTVTGAGGKTVTYEKAVEVFDAQIGVLLMVTFIY
ncbi:MAG: hypothetical protein H0W02_21780 [Ktedonobacteraceae bacterium]|nr:hypothetical protein [Ktedonobacteraceae bacterium]